MFFLYDRVACLRDALPHPSNVLVWYDFLRSDVDKWSRLIAQPFYSDSVCEKNRGSDAVVDLAWMCELCPQRACFASAKALKQHQRVTHGMMNPIKQFIGDFSTCPACGTDFMSRLRLITHVTDRRRGACQAFIVQNCPRIPKQQFDELEAFSRQLHREAAKRGHSHVLAAGSACTRQGKRIGRVQNS